MRVLLEFLGLARPDPNRRDPVALPTWTRHLAPMLAGALALVSLGLLALMRALVG